MAAVTVGPVLEENVFRVGLQALERVLGSEDLLVFPTRPNGTSLLLRKNFFERILSGNMELQSFPAVDVTAAQTDVRQLSLAQLLFLRCKNIEFNASTPSVKAYGDFLTSVDDQLDRRIGEKLAPQGCGLVIEPGHLSKLVRLVLLIYGVHWKVEGDDAEPKSYRWLVRFGQFEAILSVMDCRLSAVEEGEQALTYCQRSLSRATSTVSKARKQLHWEVELSENPKAFQSAASTHTARPEPLRRQSTRSSVNAHVGEQASMTPAQETEAEYARTAERAMGDTLVHAKEVSAEVDRLRQELALALSKVAEADALRAKLEEASMEESRLRQELALAHNKVGEVEEALRAKLEAELVAERARTEDAAAKARSELDEMQARYSQLSQDLETSRAAQDGFKSTITDLQSQLAAAAAATEAAAASCPAPDAEAKCQVEALQAELAARSDAAADMESQLAASKEMVAATEAKLAASKEALVATEAELATAREEVASARDRLVEAEEAASRGVSSEMVASTANLEEQLEALRAELTETKAAASAERDAAEQERAAAAASVDRAEALRAELTDGKSRDAEKVQSLEAEAAMAREEAQGLREALAAQASSAESAAAKVEANKTELAALREAAASSAKEVNSLRAEVQALEAKLQAATEASSQAEAVSLPAGKPFQVQGADLGNAEAKHLVGASPASNADMPAEHFSDAEEEPDPDVQLFKTPMKASTAAGDAEEHDAEWKETWSPSSGSQGTDAGSPGSGRIRSSVRRLWTRITGRANEEEV